MLVIGLTGGIGSGKSTVSRRFSDLGVPVIDADEISRTLVEPGNPTLEQIINEFGEEFRNPSGQLNRARLRDHIFADKRARLALESILHPAIRSNMADQLSDLDTPYAILVIPLMTETGQADLVDRVLVVDVPESLQVQRVMLRDNISRSNANRILDNQASREERLALADDVINNECNPEELDQAIDKLHQKYLRLSDQLSVDVTRGN